MDDSPATPVWTRAGLFGFRFAFLYWLLYNLDFPLVLFDTEGSISQRYTEAWLPTIQWVGANVLHVPYEITTLPNGSGDTTFNYVQVFCFLSLAALGTVLWSILDRKRVSHPRLNEGLRVLLRYVLFVSMMSYGLAKVFKSQFPTPGPVRLLESFGDASPMGLLWTFMGYSTSYTIFAGLAEVVGGLLLLARRTATLGALIVVGVMANVVMMNLSYDVPVKLYSSHLLAMALFLILPDARRLANLFLLNRAVEPVRYYLPGASQWLRRIHLSTKALAVGIILYLGVSDAASTYVEYGDPAPKPPLYGLWQATPGSPWIKVAFDTFDRMAFLDAVGKLHRGKATLDPDKRTLQIEGRDEPIDFSFTYIKEGDRLTLQSKELSLSLAKVDLQDLPLNNRGFHWISEGPFNR